VRFFYDRKPVLFADPVADFHHPLTLFLREVVLHSVAIADGVEAEMIVEMIFVKMSRDYYLETVAPHFFCVLYPDLMTFIGRDFARPEALITVPGDVAFGLSELLFSHDHLLEGCLSHTVYCSDILAFRGSVASFDIVDH
jgi:hypothetical protein